MSRETAEKRASNEKTQGVRGIIMEDFGVHCVGGVFLWVWELKSNSHGSPVAKRVLAIVITFFTTVCRPVYSCNVQVPNQHEAPRSVYFLVTKLRAVG